MIKQQQSEGHGSVVCTRRKAPSYSFLSCSYPPSPEGRVLDVCSYSLWVGIFFSCEHLVPNSVLFFTKEITKYQDENSEKDVQDTESEGKEEKYNKKQEEPENNLDPAKDRPRKSRYLCIALKITQLFPGIYKFFLLFNSPSKLRKSLFKISSAIQIYLMFIEHSHT